MVARSDCVAAIRQASGDTLSESEALDVLERVERRRSRLEAAGTIDRMDARLRDLAAEGAAEARIKAALQQKHAVLSALARQKMQDAVLARIGTGMSYRNALLSVLEGDSRNRNSVAATTLAYEARYVGGLMGRIAKEKPHIERRLGDAKLMDDATRLMFGETVENVDPDARYLADLFSDYLELTRADANSFGANIGKQAGYVPQAHVDWRLLQVDPADWISFIKPRLDFEKTFPDVDATDVDGILGSIWDTIVLGKEPDRPSGPTGPRNFAGSLNQHRVLFFRDADAFMAYNQRFGYGNLFTTMSSQMRRMARVNAVMDRLGPNPGSMLDNLLDSLIARVRADTGMTAARRTKVIDTLQAAQSNAETGRGGAIGAAYRIVSGVADIPGSWTAAKSGATFRGVQSMAKLGGATLTAVPTDLATLGLNLRYQGRNYWAAMAQSFRHVLKGRGKGEDRSIAYLAGEGFDGIIGHLTSRYGDLDTIPGRMSRLMTQYFKWNGLSGWTDVARAAGARIMAVDMGRLADKAFDALPSSYQRVLRVHEIGPEQWDAIRATAWTSPDTGKRYVTADTIEDRNLQLALLRFYADEGVQNVIEVDASTKRWTTLGGAARPGTLGGEAVRTLMQFKGFPIAFTKRILGRAIRGSSGTERAVGAARLIATLGVAGYLSQVAKDAARGLEPKDPTEPATILQALMQSGAAGVYGDFLFASTSRFGNTTLETLAGPGITTISDLWNLGKRTVGGEAGSKEWLDSITQNIPFQNLWYTRTALDLLVLNELRESLSPGYMRRSRDFARETYGQERFLPQSVR